MTQRAIFWPDTGNVTNLVSQFAVKHVIGGKPFIKKFLRLLLTAFTVDTNQLPYNFEHSRRGRAYE